MSQENKTPRHLWKVYLRVMFLGFIFLYWWRNALSMVKAYMEEQVQDQQGARNEAFVHLEPRPLPNNENVRWKKKTKKRKKASTDDEEEGSSIHKDPSPEDLRRWWNDRIDKSSRVWGPAVTNYSWCRPSESGQPSLIYVKVPKAASSTFVGINMRIAHRVGQKAIAENNGTSCSHTFEHGRTDLLERKAPNLLWTFMRDPASRALSHFYHLLFSRRGAIPSNSELETFLETKKSFQFKYIADHPSPAKIIAKKGNPFRAIQDFVVNPYDFVGLVERKDESLAVMKMLFNLADEDMIVLSAKQSGGFDDGRFEDRCTKIQKPGNVSTYMKDFLRTTFAQRNIDYALYTIVNRSLDMTIESLGYDRVQKQIKRLRTLQEYAELHCQAKAIFPCSKNGTLQKELAAQNCYYTDSGCGYPCVDRVLSEYDGENRTIR
jgi:hypothetical protein